MLVLNWGVAQFFMANIITDHNSNFTPTEPLAKGSAKTKANRAIVQPTIDRDSNTTDQLNKQSMLTEVNPNLTMRNKATTKDYYIRQLGFQLAGKFEEYLIVIKDRLQIHFFEYKGLAPAANYGQVYIRTNNIDTLYHSFLNNHVALHPNGHLAAKLRGQTEFSVPDPYYNLLTFGQSIK